MTVAGPEATPTSDGPGPAVSKNTRSPACTSARATAVPASNWAKLERGSTTPTALAAHTIRPEQSKAAGPAAPAWYGLPIRERAASTIEAAVGGGAGGADGVAGGGSADAPPVPVQLTGVSSPSAVRV